MLSRRGRFLALAITSLGMVNLQSTLVNVMLFQFPENWIRLLGRPIRNVHFKEFSKKGTDHTLDSFRTLLDGTTNWPAVMDALEQVGYSGYVTFEYFHPFLHYPEALIEQSSDALDRILGRPIRRRFSL